MSAVEVREGDQLDFPERVTEAALRAWAESRNEKRNTSSLRCHVHFRNYEGFRDAEQHQQGLSAFMKRYRRFIMTKQVRPDLIPKVNHRLPAYLQDVTRFNPELMNRIQTSEHCTLPTKKAIEDEKRLMEAEKVKPWSLGLVVNKNENLVDPNWKREDEDRFVNEVQRETRERSAYVMVGVLQQWRKAPDRGVSLKPITDQAPSALTTTRMAEGVSVVPTAIDSEPSPLTLSKQEAGKLETVSEMDEDDNLDNVLRHSSR